MATEIFVEDFDGNGPGLGGGSTPGEALTKAAFGSWSIGGTPISAGRWQLSYPEHNDPPNTSGGSGRYVSIHSSSPEFIDTHVWLISPLINIRKYRKITLSTDLYFKSTGAATGEDTITVSVLVLDVLNHKSFSSDPVSFNTIEIIGEDMNGSDPAFIGNKSWDLSSITSDGAFIQLAFNWYSSMGSANPANVQLDNIKVLGESKHRHGHRW